MKKLNFFSRLSALLIIGILASCSLLHSPKDLKKYFFDATAQRGNSGRQEGNRWVTFQVKLLNAPQNIHADSIWVNQFTLPVEQTRVGDTIFFTALYYSQNPGAEEPLVADANYSGWVRIYYSEKTEKLKVPVFRVIEPITYP